MIKKKTCKNCNEPVKKSYNFCPNCGIQLKNSNQNWGILGKNDLPVRPTQQKAGIVSGFGDRMIDKMIGSAFRIIQKEISKEIGNPNKITQPKMRLMVNGKEITPNPKKIENIKFLPIDFSKENLKKWKNFKKIEPKSNLKRMADKIEYEIEMPGVNSIKDVSIIKLENSFEIKAIGKDRAYLKTISIDLPLKKYTLLKEILTLELDALN